MDKKITKDQGEFVGIDVGTSGARTVVISATGRIVATASSTMNEHGRDYRDPEIWWAAVSSSLHNALNHINTADIKALCVDGTSGTILPVNAKAQPLAVAKMYNDVCADEKILQAIATHAPANSGAHGTSSGLAKALEFYSELSDFSSTLHKVVHQADWIASKFSGCLVSDSNNALKTGFDPVNHCWPQWLQEIDSQKIDSTKIKLDKALLPKVQEPGSVVATVLPKAAKAFNLPEDTKIMAGTTDGCASFLATGAQRPGDGVTILGTTLTIKLLSKVPVFSPESGVYSHRLLNQWLVGGASNTGGNVLLQFFSPSQIEALSACIDAAIPSGLDYYPLSKPGERFPHANPNYQPRLSPRPDDDVIFLQGILEGIGRIESEAYQTLENLGAPAVATVRTVGGGAKNKHWQKIRERLLGDKVSTQKAISQEAAYGTARLAALGFAKYKKKTQQVKKELV